MPRHAVVAAKSMPALCSARLVAGIFRSSKLGEFAHYPRARLPEALVTWLANSAVYPASDSVNGPAAFRALPPEPALVAAPIGVVVATFDPAKSYFSVPYHAKGEQVIGRADALLKVRQQLEKGRRTAIGQTAAFVGLGGLGKTQLAVEYAHAYREKYPGGVYWFNADGDLDGQLTRLAVAARWVSPASEPRVMLEIAAHQIRNRSNCLIVFDNVDEQAAIEALLPESSAGPHLLITSRVAQVGFDPVPIDRLPDEQSLNLLRLESGRSLEKQVDREAALRIAMQLEGLPLALELAGAYLRRSQGVSWACYADLLESEGVKARGLRDGPLASFTKHNADLYATLHIDESIFSDSPLLRDILDLLAWSGSASMGRGLLAVLLDVGDSAMLDVALGEAETLRILKQEQGAADQALSRFHMHRLVGDVRRAEVPLEREPTRWLRVMDRLGNWFEERREDFANLPSYEAEFDHLEVWQEHASRMDHAHEAARLLWLRAYPSFHQGQYRRTYDMMQSALMLFEQAAALDPKLEAHLRSDLGRTLSYLGDHRKAFVYGQSALDIRRKIHGEKHPSTAISLNNVGFALGDLGDHLKALEYQQRALDINRESLGEKHPDTATSFNNVGFAFGAFGDHRKALEYQQRALDIRREVVGEKHPDTATSLNNFQRAADSPRIWPSASG
jgi:tetratricopeptide (TPR) repeat protein